MIIDFGKFKLVSSDNRFHVIERKVVENIDPVTRRKTGKTTEKEIEVCYDMKFEYAVRYILDRTVNDKDITVDPYSYLEIYRKEREQINNILNNEINQKSVL